MEREHEQQEELIDLGAASIETKGAPGTQVELSAIGRAFGISDE